MDPVSQLKSLAPFLDPHLLLHLLQKNVREDSKDLQEQIKSKLLGAKAEEAKQVEKAAKDKAHKLMTLLSNPTEQQKLRTDMQFTLEKLRASEKKITIEDCQALFDYAKVEYELQKYKEAEKLLFNLKEILVNETFTHAALVSQVFWGLLACEILNGKSREVIELTTVRKIKDMLKTRLVESPMAMLHQTSWLLHWSLVFSFTAERSNGLFAAMLADKQTFGEAYLNVIQLNNHHLLRHMISAFLLGRSSYQPQPNPQSNKTHIASLAKDSLPRIALPIILSEKSQYSDSFTQFVEALFEDFDFDKALELADKMANEAENDLLLKPHCNEIRRQACLYVFEVQSRLYKSGNDLKTFCDENQIADVDRCRHEVLLNLKHEGHIVVENDLSFDIQGNQYDVKGKIHNATGELLRRTEDLNKSYGNHVDYLKSLQTKEKEKEVPKEQPKDQEETKTGETAAVAT